LVVLPRWYGPHDNPPIPFVISPHGRSVEPQLNALQWGNLPALGSFAVVNPEGQGNRLESISWGAPGQIADLSRMPQIVTDALPWLRIAPHRIYAVGASMGGQETLLLLAQHPRLLAGAAALDAPTNLAARYRAFRSLPYGIGLQQLARLEFGGTPLRRHDAYADRSPLFYARQIARSGVPLQIWWSTQDRTVVNGAGESGLLYRAIMRLNPRAPVSQTIGAWAHAAEFNAARQLPLVLDRLGLIKLVTS
jgi:pimeloyl-ACP methyl ester carboxylesterase